jgi:ABC-type spermidine/putrescine transport system permease subunit I
MLSIFNFLTRVRVYLFFIILCSIGGTTWALQKLGLNNSLPLWSAGMRFFYCKCHYYNLFVDEEEAMY